jgi:hypothetical protein
LKKGKIHCPNQDKEDYRMNRMIMIDEITYKINGSAMKVHNTTLQFKKVFNPKYNPVNPKIR